MSGSRPADRAVWRAARPILEAHGYKWSATKGALRCDAESGLVVKLLASLLWFGRKGQMECAAFLACRHVQASLNRLGFDSPPLPDDPRSKSAFDFSYHLSLQYEYAVRACGMRHAHSRIIRVRPDQQPEEVAEQFMRFTAQFVEPLVEMARTPLGFVELALGPGCGFSVPALPLMAASLDSGQEKLARSLLEIALSGAKVASKLGYSALPDGSADWPVARSLLKRLGGNPDSLPDGVPTEWPDRMEQFRDR